MRKTNPFLRILPLLIMTICSLMAFAGDEQNDYEVPMYEDEDRKYETDPEGRRSMARPLFVTLSTKNGVSIPYVDTSTVETFEVYDAEGYLIASFTDDIEFVYFVLSNKGILKLRINLPASSLFGYIHL